VPPFHGGAKVASFWKELAKFDRRINRDKQQDGQPVKSDRKVIVTLQLASAGHGASLQLSDAFPTSDALIEIK
jgi:hypothetical protein